MKRALQGAGIKQDEAAKILGVSRPTLSIWCNKDSLSQEIIQNVKTKLGIDLLKTLIIDESTSVIDGTDQVKEWTERLTSTIEEAKASIYESKGLGPDENFDLAESLRLIIKTKDEIILNIQEVVREKDARLRDKDEIIKLLKEQIAVKSSENDFVSHKVVPGQLETKK